MHIRFIITATLSSIKASYVQELDERFVVNFVGILFLPVFETMQRLKLDHLVYLNAISDIPEYLIKIVVMEIRH